MTTLSDKQSPLMLIVAGVNGAGKSTLYEVHPELFSNTERINADDFHLLSSYVTIGV